MQDKKRMKVAHDEASRTEVEGPSLSKYREKMDQMLLPIFRKKQKLDRYIIISPIFMFDERVRKPTFCKLSQTDNYRILNRYFHAGFDNKLVEIEIRNQIR